MFHGWIIRADFRRTLLSRLNSRSLGLGQKSRRAQLRRREAWSIMLHLQRGSGRAGVHSLPEVLLCTGSRKLFGGELWQYFSLLQKPFLFSPLWKEVCWQSADSAFIGSQQLGSEKICNRRLWLVHSRCTHGYFTGYFILNNCLSWKLAIIFNYTNILYSNTLWRSIGTETQT